MAVQHPPRPASLPTPDERPIPAEPGGALRALAVLRIVTGAIFLWAFLDKALGLGYATASERSWLQGGSPAQGYLSGVSVGPLESTFHAWAGEVAIDWLYMAGMGGLGISLVLGIGLRVTAVAGPLMMLMLWVSEFPPARFASDGTPTMSPNPVIDAHVVYAGVMVVVALYSAGRVYGLGGWWERTQLVRNIPWLR
ncbi:hypothetical protein FH609_004585 [Streptomyces sp. 3MP-14]|uniref:DoxX family membrane protein n=1 Tax=Streptomyces mimosae TaxID=2586635 RepID=A0A5N6A2J2_9ACTN|nr:MULTISPECIES: hypothetical protein [Streptomyces]KAB8162997.1 hypothetical protein FH607_020445 [Streptomyces mimosae]KAB8179212.1 hypothetical protein FH609_004585 [Streptomyces sp. 3MP-14]